MPTAFYAGSFDPITNGHLDVVRQAYRITSSLVIGVGVHPGKAPLFSPELRVQMVEESCAPIAQEAGGSLSVIAFDDLTAEAAKRVGASLLIRGLRDGTDLDYEMQISGMNAALAPALQTVFLPASAMMRPITGTLVRQIATMGGDVSSFVPSNVLRHLRQLKQ